MAPADPVLDPVLDADLDADPTDEGLDPAVLGSLTGPQREAVLAADPMLCVLAGAGAGKTRVLTLRVARRVTDGSGPGDRTLVCTFTRKAASELRDRLWRLGASSGVTAGTIHRTALRILQQHRADHRFAPPVLVADRRSLVAEAIGEGGGRGGGRGGAGSGNPQLPVARVEAEIGWAKAKLVRVDDYEQAVRAEGRRVPVPAGPAAVAEAYGRYEALRRRRGVLDLDDLLVVSADVLADDPAFAAAVRWRYRHLYVDEMQDVNPAQFRLICSLLGDEPDLFVVGDPHQSVYGWNGADPSLLDRFPSIFFGTRVIRLDRNHRSSPQVVAAAGAALGVSGLEGVGDERGDGRVPEVVSFDSDVDEASWVARRIWRDHRPGSSWSRVAVLARTNAQLPLVAEALERERVPYRIAGSDLAPASDLGRTGRQAAEGSGAVGGGSARLFEGSPDREVVDDDVVGVGVGVESEGSDAAERGVGVDGVAADEMDDVDIGPMAAPVPGAARMVSADGVVLSTFHKAKGLEWSSVFVIGVAEGLVPLASARSAAALAEERRLLYVAMTRAEERLHLSWAERPGGPGGGTDGAETGGGRDGRRRKPCRWLDAITSVLADLAAAQAPTDPAETAARLAALRAELAARSADRR